jgi:hypothetical protein
MIYVLNIALCVNELSGDHPVTMDVFHEEILVCTVKLMRCSILREKIMKKVVIALMLLLPLHLSAAESSKQEKVDALVEVMNLDEMVDAMHIQIQNMMNNLHQNLEITESERPLFDEYYQKVGAVMQEQLSWKQFEPMMLDIYNKHFTEEEITAMLEFYRSETGQSILSKMPVVMQESMVTSQAMAQRLMPEVQALTEEFDRKLKEHRKQESQK